MIPVTWALGYGALAVIVALAAGIITGWCWRDEREDKEAAAAHDELVYWRAECARLAMTKRDLAAALEAADTWQQIAASFAAAPAADTVTDLPAIRDDWCWQQISQQVDDFRQWLETL